MYRQQITQFFMSGFLPSNHVLRSYGSSWIARYAEYVQPTAVIDVSFLALCSAAVGQDRNDRWMTDTSVALYTRGLKELQKALWNPEEMFLDETLAAVAALTLYETIECPDRAPSGYLGHLKGLTKLVQLRGPAAHVTPLGHRVFCTFRIFGILDALDKHTDTFLADPAWIDGPWQGLEKSTNERILDVLAAVPGLLKKGDDLARLPLSVQTIRIHRLISYYWTLDEGLQQVARELPLHDGPHTYWPILPSMENPADEHILGRVFPTVFCFSDLTTAHSLMLYWTVAATVWAGLAGTYYYWYSSLPKRSRATVVERHGRLRPLGEREMWITMARNACRCMEFCLREPMSGYARLLVAPSLTILMGYFKADPRYHREHEWSIGLRDLIGAKGMRILKFYVPEIYESTP